MLGDDVQQKAVKITYKGVSITAKVISELIKAYLAGVEKEKFGKQSIKRLNKKGRAIDSIPVSNADVKGLQKELKKYGVDYSVRKSITEPNTYDVYFKGQDIQQIQTALKNHMTKSFQKKPSVKEQTEAAKQKAKEYNESRDKPEKKMTKGRDER
ncbi:MAG: PcfB family protein [Clostridiaceae bacterium]|mgnify:CR=1 FL=1|nr:PcfB family protein [Clostridiaceae bacterium]